MSLRFQQHRLKRRVASAIQRFRGRGRPNSSFRELFDLAWPIAAAMAGETVLGLVDTKLVGGLGPRALGGVGVATTFMFLNYSIIFGLTRGVKVRTAHAVGAGSAEDGVRYAQAGALLAATWGVGVFVLGRDIGHLLLAIGIDAAVVPYGRDFFAAVTFGAPAIAVVAALTQHRQAIGDARTPMVVGLAGNALNALLAYSLIYGHFGAPALGVRGAGYATAVVENLQAIVLVALLVRDVKKSSRRSRLGWGEAARHVAGVGVPTGLHFGAELLAFSTFTAIVGSIAASEIAAHQVAMAIIRTSFLPGVAVGESACILVGRALGKRRIEEADEATRSALLLGVGFMSCCGVIFGLFGGRLARAFTDDPAVAHTATRLLWVAALFQVLDAVNIVLRGALRGAKDVRFVAILGIAIVWTCVPGAAFALAKRAGLGALGGWYGFLAETTLAATVFWLRWRRGAWRKEYEARPKELEGATAFPMVS